MLVLTPASRASEEVRPVVGFPGYFVTSEGRVISTKRGKEIVLASEKRSPAYPSVTLCLGRDAVSRTVHSLVADAFLGMREKGTVVRHLDGDPTNCKLANLAYGTYRDNEEDKERHGRRIRGEQIHGSRRTKSEVVAIRKLYASGLSHKEINKLYPMNVTCLHSLIHGYTWKHIPVPDYSTRVPNIPHSFFIRGELSPNAKLQAADVIVIRNSLASGVRAPALAKKYGVSYSAIRHIREGSTWKHLLSEAA